ncbi:hypothetical protein [Caballeronia arationis]|uniref:hypothetical protein n=1 Tax=Caballeronia arationis TaxID=1777142 RepID=UPI001198283C|nr:hypothetical protein [Caballeronia arationis]
MFEQKQLGNLPNGCELGGIDFAQVAMARGAKGSLCGVSLSLYRARLDAGFDSHRVARSHVDPAEAVATPERLKA